MSAAHEPGASPEHCCATRVSWNAGLALVETNQLVFRWADVRLLEDDHHNPHTYRTALTWVRTADLGFFIEGALPDVAAAWAAWQRSAGFRLPFSAH